MQEDAPNNTSLPHARDDDRDGSDPSARNAKSYDMENEDVSAYHLEVTENGEKVKGQMTPTQGTHMETAPCFCLRAVQLVRRRHGLVLALISAISLSFRGLLMDILTETLDSFQVVLIHVPVYMICCLLLVLYAQVRPPRSYKHYLWLLGSGVSQSATSCFLALALTSLPFGDTVTIYYTALVQVTFFSRIVLKEPMRLLDLLFSFIAFGGVVFIARPPFIFKTNDYSDVTLQGIIFALGGSSCFVTLFVINRKLSQLGVNSFFCMFSNGTMVVLTSGLLTVILWRWRWPTLHEWLFAVLAGIAYMCGNFTLFYALKVETATLVTVIITTEIIFAFLWQVVFLHQLPFWSSYIGTVLIFAACIGITLKNKPPEPPAPPPPPPPLPPPVSTPTERPTTVETSDI